MNWIESSIEGSKLFICSGCTCTCRDAISDQEKEAAGLLAESFYCRRDFSGCLAKASPSNSVEAMDSVNSNAAREGSDGSNCDRVFILFDIFHCSNCDDELQEHRIVYGEIIENIDQIREELNGMRQRLKKLLLRNSSTEFPPMESITSNVSHTSSGVIDDRVRGSAINDTEIKNEEDDIRKQKSRSEDKAKDTDDHKKSEIRKQRSMSEDKDKETADHKKELITPNVSYEWSGVIDKRVHSSVPKDTEIKHQEESITSSVSYEWPGVIDNRVHGSVSKDTKTKQKEDDIRKQRLRSEDKAKEAADHKKELMTSKISYESSREIDKGVHGLVLKDTEMKKKEDTIVANVSYESYKEINNRVHGSDFNVTEIKNQEDDIRKQRSMGEDKEKEAVNNKKESITSNISYERSGVFENRVHDSVLNDTGIRHKEESITSNVSYESSWEIDNRVPSSFLNDTEIKNKEESIISNGSYEWPGVIDSRVHGSIIKDTKTKQKEDDIRKQWSMSEDKAKEAADHKKELMTSKVSYESSREIDKCVHGLVLKDTEMKKKEDDIRKQKSSSDGKTNETGYHKKESITSSVSYEWPEVIDNRVHGSVIKDTKTKQKEDDIRKQRSMSEDKAKEAADHKKELMTSKVSYESSWEIDTGVHDLILKETEKKKKEDTVVSNVSYESYEEINDRVHGSVFNVTEIKNQEDDIRKQKSSCDGKTNETDYLKKESITSNVSYQWSGMIDNRVHGSVSKDTKTKHKEDDIRKQKSMNEDKAKEAVDHKKELMSSKVSYESSREIDKGVHGLVLKDIELKQKEDDIQKQRSISEDKRKGTIDRKKESIISDVSYESSRVAYNHEDSQIKSEEESMTSTVSNESPKLIDNHVHGSVLKHKVDDNRKPKARSKDKTKEINYQKKESITSNISYESSEEIDNCVHVSVINAAEIKNKEDDIRRQRLWSKDKAKEAVDHKMESITSNVPHVSSGEIDNRVHGLFFNDAEIKNKEDVIGEQKSRSGDKEKETAHPQKTSTYKQNTKPPRRQRLPRKENIWPGSEEIRYGGDGSVMETEIQTDDKIRPRRQRLERGSDVFGDGFNGSVLKDAGIKLKDDDDIPNPWSDSNLKAKETIDDNKDYVPNPVSTSEDESEETVDDNKETVDSIPSNDSKSEGFEVIGEDVPEIKPKDTSSHCQKPRPRRQRLQRKGKVWPGYEVIGDGVHGSILMEIEIKHASSYNQKTRQRLQRLQRKV